MIADSACRGNYTPIATRCTGLTLTKCTRRRHRQGETAPRRGLRAAGSAGGAPAPPADPRLDASHQPVHAQAVVAQKRLLLVLGERLHLEETLDVLGIGVVPVRVVGGVED